VIASEADNVIPFGPPANSGDWTAAELERLSELSDRLEAQGARVETAYGVSDAGDPWCAITDAQGEVLIHVARIDGRFVIHDAAADAVQDGDSLWSAFDRVLGDVWRDGRKTGDVIPLHQAQVLLALVAALAFEQNARTDHDAPAAHLPAAERMEEEATASRNAAVTLVAAPTPDAPCQGWRRRRSRRVSAPTPQASPPRPRPP
jgi:hypothetical protein